MEHVQKRSKNPDPGPDLPVGYVGSRLGLQDPSFQQTVVDRVNCRYMISSINVPQNVCLNYS